MARRTTEDADPRAVVLLNPDGGEYRSNSPTEISRLHYGLGYTFRDVSSFQEALDFLGDEAAVPTDAPPPGPVLADDATAVDATD